MIGWIKLHRTLKDWEWYDDINATRLLVHLLVSVNYEPKKWKGILIESGSMVLSWESLSNGCNLSVQQCRTAMTKLKNSKEVTIKSTNKYQVVTLMKWDELQSKELLDNKQPNNQITNKQQSNNKQVTTTKEVNNIITKEIKKTIIDRKAEFKNSLFPFLEQYGNELLNDFYGYWTEHGDKDRKMRYEKQTSFSLSRRLTTWDKRQKVFNKEKSSAKKESAAIILQRKHGLI